MADKEKGYKTRTYLEKDAPHLVETKAKLDKDWERYVFSKMDTINHSLTG